MEIAFVVLSLILAGGLLGPCEGLECYVCNQQEGNVEKCLSTVRTCESDEDTCLTEVRWGSTPYWSQGAEKQYYVTKTCSTKDRCDERQSEFIHYCHRIWYEDWKCAECCKGDRCNYYVFLGAGTTSVSLGLLSASLIITLFQVFRFRHL